MAQTTQEERVSLQNLARGAVVERFDDELTKVLDNIMDPNTTMVARKITVTVSIKPGKDRSVGSVDVSCKSTPAPALGLSSTIFIGRDKSGAVATEFDPKQSMLPGINEQKTEVTPLKSVAGGGK